MSILIKGMDMPKENQICKIEIHPDGHCAVMRIEEGDCYSLEFNSDTQAIQIPTPHGRIIDASEIYKQPHCGECNDATLDAINNAPTILDSEE